MITHVRGGKSRPDIPAGNRLARRRQPEVILIVAEVLVEFAEPVLSRDGARYMAQACGKESDGGTWEGWVEFLPVDGRQPIRSSRETTQPNRQDTVYWAT